MSKKKLSIRFHNPNTEDETHKYIAQIFLEASRVKFENILREASNESRTDICKKESSEMAS